MGMLPGHEPGAVRSEGNGGAWWVDGRIEVSAMAGHEKSGNAIVVMRKEPSDR
jgi:hypothetical protein